MSSTIKKAYYTPVPKHIAGYLTMDEAAEKLGLARETVRLLAWRRQIESYKPSPRRVYIPIGAITKFIERRTRALATKKRSSTSN